jgi:hypothetical protein
MNDTATLETQARQLDLPKLDALIDRVTDLDNAYRAIAEKAGQLYMKADEDGLTALTELLDKPMRNASDNQQTFAALLADLKMHANSHR